MNYLFVRVREHYEALGAEPRPGVAPEEVAAFESARAIRLPWAITRTLPGADQYPAFGDGMCWSHVLAVHLGETSGVLWICGEVYAEVAPTFEEFWARYLADADSVLWPGEGQLVAPAV